MGLDIRVAVVDRTGPHASWSYHGFNHFRSRLAAAANIDLREMNGYIPNGQPWPSTDKEPLVHLLDHSDCDGTLGYTECAALLPRLRELLPVAFPGEDASNAYDRRMGEELIAACEAIVDGDGHEVLFQ